MRGPRAPRKENGGVQDAIGLAQGRLPSAARLSKIRVGQFKRPRIARGSGAITSTVKLIRRSATEALCSDLSRPL